MAGCMQFCMMPLLLNVLYKDLLCYVLDIPTLPNGSNMFDEFQDIISVKDILVFGEGLTPWTSKAILHQRSCNNKRVDIESWDMIELLTTAKIAAE